MDNTKTTAKDFFLNVGLMASFYTAVISFINLAFSIINSLFPDILRAYFSTSMYSRSMRISIATLVISLPIYLILSTITYREYSINPEKKNIWVRRWLVYLTLFVSGVAIAVDAIILINAFLEGELVMRLFLKIFTLFVVAGAAFFYYLYDLKGKFEGTKIPRLFAAASVLVAVGFIAWSFSITGLPSTVRTQKLDQRRVNDLSSIQYQVVRYWQLKRELPSSLDQLNNSVDGYKVPVDPQTQQSYEYAKLGDLKFNLCATFAASSVNYNYYDNKPMMYESYDQGADYWNHGSGRTCFERTIDPTLYPPTTSRLID